MSDGEAALRGSLLGVKARSRTILEEIDRIPASDDAPRVGGASRTRAAPAIIEKQRALAAGELHVVREVSFGPGRRATCVACSFVATGRDDKEMAKSFNWHAFRARTRFDRVPGDG